MFWWNTQVEDDLELERKIEYSQKRKQMEEYLKWQASKEYNRLSQLETLIEKAYESVNIKPTKFRRLFYNFTREDCLADFEVFFRPEVYNKLKEWCKEYRVLCKKENELLGLEGEDDD